MLSNHLIVFRLLLSLAAIYVILIIFSLTKSSLKNTAFEFKTNESYIHRRKMGYSINDSLFLRQTAYVLPPKNGDIFGWMKFAIFPMENITNSSDRVYSQMRYVPSGYQREKESKKKLILFYNGDRGITNKDFEVCPVRHCTATGNRNLATKADIIIWVTDVFYPFHVRPPGQIWAFFFHESPKHTPNFKYFEEKPNSLINWTISYRPDSTLSVPYYYYSPYDLINNPPPMYPLPKKNYAEGKTKMIAWFASNCNPANDRYEVVQRLNQYIKVDSYGKCGNMNCPREKSSDCFGLLNSNYKFYLSFENSYCRYYITEKLFLNGLSHNVIPIVLGAHPDDYKRVAPPHSYIHIEEFKTLKELAKYLLYLDRNDTAYNEYFSWKTHGSIHFDQSFLCRLCMIAHEAENTKTYYSSLYTWWHKKDGDICFKSGRWT